MKQNFLRKIINFFKEVWLQIKKINWLSRQEVFKYTMIVIGVAVSVAAFLGGLDFIFATLIKEFIL